MPSTIKYPISANKSKTKSVYWLITNMVLIYYAYTSCIKTSTKSDTG